MAQDHDGQMKDEKVRYDHPKHPADLSLVSDHKMQSRPEYQCLTSDHTPPTDADDDADSVRLSNDLEVKEEEAQCV